MLKIMRAPRLFSAIEGVGAPSFLRRYAADTVRGGGSFFSSRISSRIGPSAWKFLTSVVKKKKKNLVIQMYPNVLPRSK